MATARRSRVSPKGLLDEARGARIRRGKDDREPKSPRRTRPLRRPERRRTGLRRCRRGMVRRSGGSRKDAEDVDRLPINPRYAPPPPRFGSKPVRQLTVEQIENFDAGTDRKGEGARHAEQRPPGARADPASGPQARRDRFEPDAETGAQSTRIQEISSHDDQFAPGRTIGVRH